MILDSERKLITLPPNTAVDWPVWRVVSEGMATLSEIERHWWIEDVLDANEVLDVLEQAKPRRRSPDWGER